MLHFIKNEHKKNCELIKQKKIFFIYLFLMHVLYVCQKNRQCNNTIIKYTNYKYKLSPVEDNRIVESVQ